MNLALYLSLLFCIYFKYLHWSYSLTQIRIKIVTRWAVFCICSWKLLNLASKSDPFCGSSFHCSTQAEISCTIVLCKQTLIFVLKYRFLTIIWQSDKFCILALFVSDHQMKWLFTLLFSTSLELTEYDQWNQIAKQGLWHSGQVMALSPARPTVNIHILLESIASVIITIDK